MLAVVLMAIAFSITSILFPPPDPPQGGEDADSAAVPSEAPPVTAVLPQQPLPTGTAVEDSVVVVSDLYRYVFTTQGAALAGAALPEYPSYSLPGEPVQMVPSDVNRFLEYRLVVGADTLDLASLPFTPSVRELRVEEEGAVLDLSYDRGDGLGIVLRYTFRPDEYLITVSGRVNGAGRGAQLLTEIGPGLGIHEHPDHHSERELAVVTNSNGRVKREPFRRVTGVQAIADPLIWAGIKDKYFLAAVIAGDREPLSGTVLVESEPQIRTVDGDEVEVPRVLLVSAVPITDDGSFGFDAYLGPQDYGRLSAIGFNLENVTPYGYRWLEPVIRPLAAAILWVLGTLHGTLGIAYGWVLVLFGVLLRVVLWPLHAKAMRAQMKNMAVQPLLQEIREKYAKDPQKQQEAMLTLYKEHGFNPFAGCLPLLVPMPVLITLFFVFQNTIVFRGAAFLWLPDLSLRDPYYILPAILVVSMFTLQWVMAQLSGMEQNPQMKTMMYVMPIMMGVIFFMLPAGLNLYYAVSQVASIPQQILISRERRRAQEELKRSGGPQLSKPGGGGRTRSRAKR